MKIQTIKTIKRQVQDEHYILLTIPWLKHVVDRLYSEHKYKLANEILLKTMKDYGYLQQVPTKL
ncbi:MAG TPA: hypothetical protein VH796_00420 [Nitrososphaeraceae archaeon]